MYIGKIVTRMRDRVKGDPRFRGSFVYELSVWLRNPGYAALRRREISFYHQLLGKDGYGLIFDLGASGGSKAEIFQKYGRVICVEPGTFAADLLKTRFAFFPNIRVVEAAVSNRQGEGTLLEFEPGSAYNTLNEKTARTLSTKSNNRFGFTMPHPTAKQVRLTTIDELVRQFGQPDFIKIDIEGSELVAIQGMSAPCKLISAEFGLPEFVEELAQVIERLGQLGRDVLFNAAISEPPIKFEFSDWLSGPVILESIKTAGWDYVELYCRSSTETS